jgi:hypothetical protein
MDHGFLYGTFLMLWFAVFFFSYQSTSIFLLQDNLIKDRLQTAIILFLQLSPHHQRMMMMKHKLMVHLKMEHQVTTLPNFSYKS